ncbi:5305_t:CDS:2 [Entrophospora sp. SA101]|nr:5305_t:CDS:2 [Entrophospora sp. SA101]
MSSIPPNQSLYIRNLNEKTNKDAYGRILDIVALKTIKMRGQAFIVFREIQSATAAMRGLNGFNFYDKPMHIEYAKGKSDAVAKLDGTWKKPGTISSTQRSQTVTGQLGVSPAQKRQREEEGVFDNKRAANGEAFKESEFDSLEVNVTDEMLSFLFQQYPGFKEVRLVPGKSDIAFVEYEADHQAAVAKDVLNGFKITHDKEMKVTFARR